MNYVLLYNSCNLNKVEGSGTDITSVGDDVLSEAGLYE
jgi:predicted small secreted protein